MKDFAHNEYVIWVELNDSCKEYLNKKCVELESDHIKPGVGPPHMTLTFVKTEHPEELKQYTESFVNKNIMDIILNSISMFPAGVLFYAPQVTKELLLLHEEYCRGISDFGELSWELYVPGKWVPHVALTGELDAIERVRAFSIMNEGFIPMSSSDDNRVLVKHCLTGETLLDLPFLQNTKGRFNEEG
ncbi:MAG: hypothetical protein Q4D16_26080 [Eubacteriales bacterium]|nr:hypothetical protein [Eubacteriales bacterium]